jgi:hypothetical protein
MSAPSLAVVRVLVDVGVAPLAAARAAERIARGDDLGAIYDELRAAESSAAAASVDLWTTDAPTTAFGAASTSGTPAPAGSSVRPRSGERRPTRSYASTGKRATAAAPASGNSSSSIRRPL